MIPTQPLLEILRLFDIKHDGTLEDIEKKTQAAWIRTGERWDLPKTESDPHLYALFQQLGMTEKISAGKAHYVAALVLGATRPAVRARKEFLLHEVAACTTWDRLYLLGGQRILRPEEGVGTETEMMREEFEGTDAITIDAPRRPGGERPRTQETFEAWLKTDPRKGDLLVISNQPFILRQKLVAQNNLPKEFIVEAAGPAYPLELYMKEPKSTALFLDELARIIHEYYKSVSK